MMKRNWLLAGGLVLTACGGGEPAGSPPRLESVTVSVSDALTGSGSVAHVARVEASSEADVATRASGTLVSLPVDVGDRVRRGQVLASLDDADVEARIDAAAAGVELAERTHGRVERLAADGAASQQELDEAFARLQAARAQLAEARAQASYVQVTAPFDGVVVERYADPGDLAVPGQPVLRLAGTGAVTIAADLPAHMRAGVEMGQNVRVVDSDGRSTEATVSRVVPTLDAATGRFQVELAPSGDSQLTAGETVRLELSGAGSATRWVPVDALLRRGQLVGVYVLESDTLRLRWVRIGREEGPLVELLAGPPGALTVVRRPAATLRDGQPVSSSTREEIEGVSVPAPAGAGR